MMTTNTLHDLPGDCQTKIISYLPLYNVLSYSISSKTSLQSTISDLCTRREKLSKTIFIGDRKRKDLLFNSKSIIIDKDFHSDVGMAKLPSVFDRIQSLHQNLQTSHSMYESVKELIDAVNDYIEKSADDFYNEGLNMSSFQSIFYLFQQTLKIHKLHAKILKTAIYGDVVYSSNARLHDDGITVDLQLNQYLGDVYIAFIGMGNICSGLIEGVSEEKWLNCIIQNNTRIDIPTITSKIWYQNWVFLHSILMRSIQLSNIEMNEFGLSNDGTVIKSTMLSNDNILKMPPLLYQGASKTRAVLTLYRTLRQSDGLMSVVFRQFGPLGHSFRGRDSVRSHEIQLKTIIECFLAREWKMFGEDNDMIIDENREEDLETIVQNRSHSTQYHQTIMRLAFLHRESRKVRPMTCAPHTVSFQSIMTL